MIEVLTHEQRKEILLTEVKSYFDINSKIATIHFHILGKKKNYDFTLYPLFNSRIDDTDYICLIPNSPKSKLQIRKWQWFFSKLISEEEMDSLRHNYLAYYQDCDETWFWIPKAHFLQQFEKYYYRVVISDPWLKNLWYTTDNYQEFKLLRDSNTSGVCVPPGSYTDKKIQAFMRFKREYIIDEKAKRLKDNKWVKDYL